MTIDLTKVCFVTLLYQLKMSTTNKKAIRDNIYFVTKGTDRCPGGGRPKKWLELEDFIKNKLQYYWEIGAPVTTEQLRVMVQQHIVEVGDRAAVENFIKGKPNTFHQFISRVLDRHHWSVRKITISQSVPIDWREKAQANSARIRKKFSDNKVDVVVNADETFLLFHSLGEKLIAPTGIKRVGSLVQVDNEKSGATVMIACEYRTSSILPPMIIFTGVHCAKLMTHWAKYSKGESHPPSLLALPYVSLTIMLVSPTTIS